ncbi:MAG: hypothetical protein EXQ89_01840 [Rhodospirillaceae bacterium]|nr:hypothetical protein [Rhodospirillaceae bacterium]
MGAGGCSFGVDSLWPTLTGEDPRTPPRARTEIPPSPGERVGQPFASPPVARPVAPAQSGVVTLPSSSGTVMATPSFPAAPPQPSAGGFTSTSGTVVGAKVGQTREEVGRLNASVAQRNAALQQLRADSVQTAQRFHSLVAGINARLQVGTTPGNPIMVSQWDQAQGELDRIGNEVSRMNLLASQVAADASVAAYLLESTRAAYSVAGAFEEDHRQLALLEDEVNRTVVGVDRLLSELSEDVSRQSSYLGNERSNMIALSVAIKNGELYGASLANRSFSAIPGARIGSNLAAAPAAPAADRRPLVVIRFDRARPDYEQALYTAVSRALERQPTVAFDLVAVAPARGSAAELAQNSTASRRNAETVMRSLTDMGLPPDRVALSATTSTSVQVNEVQIFVR